MSQRIWALAGLALALTPAAGHAAPPAASPAYQFAPGQRAVFSVVYASAGDANFTPLLAQGSQASGPAPSMAAYKLATELTGQMEVTVTEASASEVEEWCVFRAPRARIVINSQLQAGGAAALQGELSRGFLVDLKPDGTIVRVRMAGSADATSQAFLRAFLALGQVVLSPGLHWEAREQDPNGAYRAEYQVEPDPAHAGAWVLRKRIAGYLPADQTAELPGETQMRQVVTPDLRLAARLDHGGADLAALDATLSSDTAIEGQHVAHSMSGLRLIRTGLTDLTPAQLAVARVRAASLAATAVASALFQQRSAREAETNIERTELGAATPQALMARLGAIDAAGADARKDETDALYLKFKALAYLHPEADAPLGARLAGEATTAPSFRLLAGALGAVGDAQAQAAIAAAIRARPTDWPALSALVPELCTLPAPTDDAEDTVRGLRSNGDPNISAMAWLCLGGMAHGLAQAEPIRARAILGDLARGLAAADDENAKALMLQGLGNANSAAALPIIAPYAASPSPVLRAAAMDAMRAIPLPDVDPLLRAALAGDADAKVRLEAAFALGFRPASPELFAAERAALAADQDADVRAALVSDLAKLAAAFPEALALLQTSAANDPSEDVRKTAANLLQSLGR
ncbi:MAG TPA: HEAT repeat domain-containing protein [Caulobacteraceae bacterium]|nr:HEAT repeat domain-containing protein [Caulobacteraceae bacterium]